MRKAAIVFLLSTVTGAWSQATTGLRSTFVRDFEVWIADGNGANARKITDGGQPKFLPVWSPEGERIAFATESANALADLVVVSRTGSTLLHTAFRPVGSNISGMRFVESLAWLSENKIVVGGSVDPSTVEYAVLDAATGQAVGGYFTNGFSLMPSPDGKHVAYQGYIPHFGSEEGRRWQFCLDHECDFDRVQTGYPGLGGKRLDFVSDFIWSPDSLQVAAVEREAETKRVEIVSRFLDGRTHIQLLVAVDGDLIEPEWSSNGGGFAIAVSHTLSPADVVGGNARKPSEATAKAVLKDLKHTFAASGNDEVDFWCENCALRSLPRINGPSFGR